MQDLEPIYKELEFSNIRTYLQSGNVVFSGVGDPLSIARKSQNNLKNKCYLDIHILVIEKKDFNKIAVIPDEFKCPTFNSMFVHVTFLSGSPESTILPQNIPIQGDECILQCKTHLYLFCPNGYGRTKINNNYFERVMKIKATTRNWKTVQALNALLEEEQL